MNTHEIVGAAEWTRARKALLEKEKEFSRARDALAQARRDLPWERVDKRYAFDTREGERTLGDLFAGRAQLIVYHFMFSPDWEAGCKSCCFWADNFDGRNIALHLAQRDVTFLAVSRAPLAKLLAFQKRMGWSFAWVSSGRSDFNFDYHVSFDPDRRTDEPPSYNYAPMLRSSPEMPGISVFYRDEAGAIFHTYSTYARGIDLMNTVYNYLDLVPKGRDEGTLAYTMEWVRRHDEYDVQK